MKKLMTILLLCVFLLCACGENADSGKLNIVTTMFPQYDFARNIAGEYANVEMLLDFGVDVHSYEPTPADIIKISKADLFIYTGNEMEPWVKKLLESADIKKAIDHGALHVLDLSEDEDITLLPIREHEEEHFHEHGEFDTHIWTSHANAVAMCNSILHSLCEIDPENEEDYRLNTCGYAILIYRIKEMGEELKATAVRDTVYFGGSFAFRYLFDEIGIDHVSIYEGCASHAEPSAADIAKMVDAVKESGAKYVLYDTASEKKIAEAIAAECGASVLHLHAIHNISKAEFDAGEDYRSLMKKNLETLGKALSE